MFWTWPGGRGWPGAGGLPDFAHAVGLMVLTLGVAVALVVIVGWVGRLRVREGRAWASAWRVVAVCWLAGSLVEIAAALQVAPAPAPSFGDKDLMRLRLDSLTAALGMVGLILAVAPLGPRPTGMTPRPRWGSLPTLTLAAVLGLAILAFGHGSIPYLVLLALEAVHNAMRLAPLIRRPIVFDRLATACLEALPGLIGCLLTAAWVDDDLRAAARDPLEERARRSWRGTIARASTVILAASGSAYVVLVSIPKLSPQLAEGLAAVVDPSLVATVALGLAALAAGFSARSAGHLAAVTRPDDRPAARESTSRRLGPWPRRVLGGVVSLASLEITVAAVQEIRGDLEDRWYVPIRLGAWTSIVWTPKGWFGSPSGISAWDRLIERPDDALIGIVALWLTIRLAGLVAGKHAGRPSPLDLFATDRLALRRFLGCWVALTIAMLASLPGLAIVGVTLLHFVIRWTAR